MKKVCEYNSKPNSKPFHFKLACFDIARILIILKAGNHEFVLFSCLCAILHSHWRFLPVFPFSTSIHIYFIFKDPLVQILFMSSYFDAVKIAVLISVSIIIFYYTCPSLLFGNQNFSFSGKNKCSISHTAKELNSWLLNFISQILGMKVTVLEELESVMSVLRKVEVGVVAFRSPVPSTAGE